MDQLEKLKYIAAHHLSSKKEKRVAKWHSTQKILVKLDFIDEIYERLRGIDYIESVQKAANDSILEL